MGVVDGFIGAGLFAKISLLLLIISAMFSWIAYTCTGWGDAGEGTTHYGLWRTCTSTPATPLSVPKSVCTQLDGWPLDWWGATQALVTFGSFGINIALFLTILYMFVPSCTNNDWWAATQALVTFGFFGINIALFLTIIYMFVPSCTKNGEVGMATAIVCIATGILYLIGVIVFAAKFKEDFIDIGDSIPALGIGDIPEYKLGYCFGLSIVALLAEIVVGILMFLDSKKDVNII